MTEERMYTQSDLEEARRIGAELTPTLPNAGSTEAWLGDDKLPRPAGYVAPAYERLLKAAEGENWQRPGLADTPVRAARAWAELTAGYDNPPPELTTFEDKHDEMVVVAPIAFYSLCEHHLLPFHGRAYIAYIPQGKLLGLSKFARVVKHFSAKLQVQERLTVEIADYLEHGLDPAYGPEYAEHSPDLALAVVMQAEHLCMSMRGAQAPGTVTTTSVMRGAFRGKPEARAEVIKLMGI